MRGLRNARVAGLAAVCLAGACLTACAASTAPPNSGSSGGEVGNGGGENVAGTTGSTGGDSASGGTGNSTSGTGGVAVGVGPADVTTFFVWADIHIPAGLNEPINYDWMDAVRGTNEMVGIAYPAEIGGTIPQPDFVLDAGDCTEWPSTAAVLEYERILKDEVTYKVYPIAGNHDLAGTGSPKFEQFIIDNYIKNGMKLTYDDKEVPTSASSYSFEHKGVAFIGFSHTYDIQDGTPTDPVRQEDIDWLKAEFTKFGPEIPKVIWFHIGFSALENPDGFVAALEGQNVILIVGGHYHTPGHWVFGGYDFIMGGSPKTDGIKTDTVVQITKDKLSVGVWDYMNKNWVSQHGFVKQL